MGHCKSTSMHYHKTKISLEGPALRERIEQTLMKMFIFMKVLEKLSQKRISMYYLANLHECFTQTLMNEVQNFVKVCFELP
jgi:hypothetical protein